MMKKNRIPQAPPLDPVVKESGYRILERAFGEFGAQNGTSDQPHTILDRVIITEKPHLADNPEGVRAVARLLMSHFFEIVADEMATPTGKKHNEILDKFITDAVTKNKNSKPKNRIAL